MKSTPRTILFSMILFAVQSACAQVSSADTMVHRLFETLKAKDEKAFVALYPNQQQFGRFMRSLLEQSLKNDEVKKLMAQDEKSKNLNVDSLIDFQVAAVTSPEAFGKMEKAFGDMFRKTIEKGEKKGVRWNEAKLVNYTIDSTANLAEGAPFQLQGIKGGKGIIDFTVGNDAYQLAFDKMIFLSAEGGWFGAEFPQLARKGESLAPDKDGGSATEGMPAANEKSPTSKGKAPVKKVGAKGPVKKAKS